jgi:hypothetical protein
MNRRPPAVPSHFPSYLDVARQLCHKTRDLPEQTYHAVRLMIRPDGAWETSVDHRWGYEGLSVAECMIWGPLDGNEACWVANGLILDAASYYWLSPQSSPWLRRIA